MTVSACLDAACVNQVQGSPATVKVTYQVGNSLPGPTGDSVVQLPLHANALVWDPTRSVIYASTAGDSPTAPKLIAVVDPVAGKVISTVNLGGEVGALSISDDGGSLYAVLAGTNTVLRLALPGLSIAATLNLGAGLYGIDVAAAPGLPKTVAVSRSIVPGVGTGTSAGILVFDDLTQRPVVGGYGSQGATGNFDYLAWGSTPSTLYADDAGHILTTLSVSATGPQVTAAVDKVTGGRIHQVNGLIYTNAGVVFDPTSGKVAATLPQEYMVGYSAVGLDATLARLFAISADGPGTDIWIFDQKSLVLLRTQNILGAQLTGLSQYPVMLIRWGTNGIAFGADNGQLVIISGAYLTE